MPFLEGLEQIDQFDEVFHWVSQTETGDRAELSNLPEISVLAAHRCAIGFVSGSEVSRLRSLLHHADAPARDRR
jgi:hypothetical protein